MVSPWCLEEEEEEEGCEEFRDASLSRSSSSRSISS